MKLMRERERERLKVEEKGKEGKGDKKRKLNSFLHMLEQTLDCLSPCR